MSTYLITGVAGFIASRTAELLLAGGHEVVGVDNLNDYYDLRLKTYRLHRLAAAAGAGESILRGLDFENGSAEAYLGPSAFEAGRFRFLRLDIEDADGVESLFRDHRFDAVLNLAARAGVRYSLVDPRVYLATNAAGTLNLLESMRAHEVRKFVLASTSSLYAGQAMPFREDLPVNTPISPYAASKKAAEAMAYSYHHLFNIDVSVVRYFTVFGPAGRPDMSPFRFIKWIDEGTPIVLYGDGSQSRDFTYIDDIARGSIAALRPVGYEVFNLGGGNNPISINEMIGAFEDQLGRKALFDRRPFHDADMKETWACIDKARDVLGWLPEVDPREGFRLTVSWYLENRPWLAQVQV